jgi:hypothetical protein
MGRGFQTVQRSVVSSAECGVTGLATIGLDLLSLTILAISHQRMDVSISNPKVHALRVRTSETIGGYPLGRAPRRLFTSLQGRDIRKRCPCARRGSGGETTGGAIVWAAGLLADAGAWFA